MKATSGIAWLRLALISVVASGHAAFAQSSLYAGFISPPPPAVPSMTLAVKPGVPLQITGFATGPGFQSYVLEWAYGANPPSPNWFTTGITLAGDGLSPVNPGTLGTWTPPVDVVGDYTLRLTVNNGAFFSVATTAVYGQPGLLSNAWPKFVGPHKFDRGAQPVRQPDGTTRLLVGGLSNAGDSSLKSYGVDGSVVTAPLDFGGEQQAAVGNLDGLPGDEIVVSDGLTLKIFSSNLTLLRTITAPVTGSPKIFWADQHFLADIDGDGVPEIVAIGRDTDSTDGSSYRPSSGGYLYVFRMDGTLYSNNFPVFLAATISNGGLGAAGAKAIAVDVDGDGTKEILVAMDSNGTPGYTLRCVSPNGAFVPFASPTYVGVVAESVSAADLDHDGTPEIVIAESDADQSAHRIRVLNHDGSVRTGWPVAFPSKVSLAIGDLDRDQHQEIVAAASGTLTILRDNGTLFNTPITIGDGASTQTVTTPLIADIDSDGIPEILVAFTAVGTYPVTYRVGALWTLRSNGNVGVNWSFFGTEGRQPNLGIPVVGDFNGDGKTDIVVQVSLIEGGGLTGATVNSALTWFAPDMNYNAAASDWTTNFRDPQNSRRVTTSALPAVPLITTQPVNQTVTLGSSATFTAAAVGNPTPTYRWQKNGVNITGATSATLTLPNVPLSASGTYRVVATNANGSATSNDAVLTVVSLPVFTTQPTGRTVNVGANVTFTSAATGTPAPTFLWRKDAGSIAGPSSPTLVLTDVQLPDAGVYWVIASNRAGSVASNQVTLTVNQAPFFTLQPPPAQYMAPGVDHSFFVLATGTPAPTYQWQKNGVNIAGATSPRLDLPNVQSTDGGTYRAIATNSVKSTASTNMVLTVVVLPVITKQPVGKTVITGTNLTLTVTVTGTPTPFLQWQKNGVDIPGATTASLSLVNVQLTDTGSYGVNAFNLGGSVASNLAVVTVNSLPVITTQPASQTVLAGDSVTFTADASGSPSPTVRWQKNGANIAGATSSTLTLTNVAVSAAGTYRMIATNAAGSATSVGGVLTVNAAPVFTVQPVSRAANQGTTVTFTVNATGSPAPTYQWQKDEVNIPEATGKTLTLVSVQPDDAGRYQAVATNVAGSVTSNQAGLTVNVLPVITIQPVSQTTFVPYGVTFTVSATGTPAPTYRWQKNGVNISGATSAVFTLNTATLASAGTYHVIVTNSVGSVTSDDAVLVVTDYPRFTTQPAGKTVDANTDVTFTVAVTGYPTPTLQWQKDMGDIPGATGATLTLGQVQLADAGSYRVIATNPSGVTASNGAVLKVNAKPEFTFQPYDQMVGVGQPVTFTAVVTGYPAPTYIWQKDGVTIPGATHAALTLTHVKVTDAGTYVIIATNSAGSAASTGAVLTVPQ